MAAFFKKSRSPQPADQKAPAQETAATDPEPVAQSVTRNQDAEFEAEFGALADTHVDPTTAPPPDEALQHPTSDGAGELEEWSEPLPEPQLLSPLAPGTELSSSEGREFRVHEVIESGPEFNVYRAESLSGPVEPHSGSLPDDGLAAPETIALAGGPIRLREAVGSSAARMAGEAQLRTGADAVGLAPVIDFFVRDERSYLADELSPSPATLATMFENQAGFPVVLSVLIQVAATLSNLHEAGWVHLGLRPEAIDVEPEIRLVDFTHMLPLGQTPPVAISHAGYSAPELTYGTAVDQTADVYSLGALLFRAVTGKPLPETGSDWQLCEPSLHVPGVPQILRRCLGAAHTRYAGMSELHRDLLRLQQRRQPVAEYAIAAASSIGLEPGRTTNQDAYGHLTGGQLSEAGTVPWAVVCVADGMGGMAGGDIASDVAVRTILAAAGADAVNAISTGSQQTQSSDTSSSADEQSRLLKQWVMTANDNVHEALSNRGLQGGCTIVAVLMKNRRMAMAYAGDCRIYLWRNGELQCVTKDHSYVMALVAQGEVKLEDVRSHPDRNKVTRALGERQGLPDYYIDTLDTLAGNPTMELDAGDVLLLCSDGLWEPVTETEMAKLLDENSQRLAGAVRGMLKLAIQRGAPDNATVALIRIDECGEVAEVDDEADDTPKSIQSPDVALAAAVVRMEEDR